VHQSTASVCTHFPSAATTGISAVEAVVALSTLRAFVDKLAGSNALPTRDALALAGLMHCSSGAAKRPPEAFN